VLWNVSIVVSSLTIMTAVSDIFLTVSVSPLFGGGWKGMRHLLDLTTSTDLHAMMPVLRTVLPFFLAIALQVVSPVLYLAMIVVWTIYGRRAHQQIACPACRIDLQGILRSKPLLHSCPNCSSILRPDLLLQVPSQ
jgi:hypothetical protein